MAPITIHSNVASAAAGRRLARSTAELGRTFERLASGLRINRAADDAAGLSVAGSLQLDARVYVQAIRNLNDGISLLNVGERAIDELSNVVIRLRELATESATGTIGEAQRASLNLEAQALVQEYYRIVGTTKFNGRPLLDGSSGSILIQAGYTTKGGIALELGQALSEGAAGGDGTFQDPVPQPLGVATGGMAIGDLNNDGHTDLVRINSGEFGVLLGNGDGTFRDGGTYAVGTSGFPAAGALSDFNGDGTLDLVVADDFHDALRVYMGNGDGSFAAPSNISSSVGFSVAAGDLNGDGKQDIVATDYTNGELAVFLGNGDGTFQGRTSYASPASMRSVILGDFDNDGSLDAVAANGVFLGNGDGTFQPRTTVAYSGWNDGQLALGDFDRDGNLDFVLGSDFGDLNVFLGNGDGTFQPRTTYSVGGNEYSQMVAEDLNGDGVLDLVASVGPDLALLTGNGDGTFGTPTVVSALNSGVYLKAADFNGDNTVDLATAGDLYSGNPLNIILGNGVPGADQLSSIDLRTQQGALDAMTRFDFALEQLSARRVAFGSAQSRLQAATGVLSQAAEDIRSAESRIRDADVAEDAAALVRGTILQRAGAAVLAQANQAPALALALLGAAQ
jgi:flagellin-like hook-associated protein FlgL